uniref:Uncharacterized protein n=1 Tax=Arundo donax TaxID=35708 RepID=A0A0A9DQB6_ARUDO
MKNLHNKNINKLRQNQTAIFSPFPRYERSRVCRSCQKVYPLRPHF